MSSIYLKGDDWEQGGYQMHPTEYTECNNYDYGTSYTLKSDPTVTLYTNNLFCGVTEYSIEIKGVLALNLNGAILAPYGQLSLDSFRWTKCAKDDFDMKQLLAYTKIKMIERKILTKPENVELTSLS